MYVLRNKPILTSALALSAIFAVPRRFTRCLLSCANENRIKFGAKKHLDAIGKIGHDSPGRSKTFRFSTLPGVSPPVLRILVFGVTKLACSSVSDMGVVYLVVPTHTKVKRDSIWRVCYACTHVHTHSVSSFLPSVTSFFPFLSLSHSRADQSKLLLFYPRLVLLSPSRLFLPLRHMLYISLTFSLSFLLDLLLAIFRF